MVSTRGKKTGNADPPPSPPAKKAAPPENIKAAEPSGSNETPGSPPSRDNQPPAESGGAPATEGQDADQPGGTPAPGDAARKGQAGSPMAVAGGGAGGAGEAKVPRTEGAEEQKEGSQETIEVSPGGDETSARSPAGDKPADGDAVEGAGREGAGKDGCLPVDKAATSLAPDEAENATHKLGSQRQPQQPASIAAKERPDDGPAQEPWGDAMDVAEEPTLVGRVDSSDEEDEDDGFKVVVGREVAPAVTTAAPTKRFLRGTNALVNTTTGGPAGAKESGSSTASSKPVSAAAGIASLVPSKGAPVATARPSLKPGEYPPTAELQQSTGKTAFDVDIDGMEEQPWRHPGVDIADFFNYGFTEDSWRVYCEKQLRNRYDRTRGRSKPTAHVSGGRGGGNTGGSSSHTRHGGGDRPNSLQPPRPQQASQMHTNNVPPGPSGFRPLGPAVVGMERFPPGLGSAPPGHGNLSPPWFEGRPPQQQQMQQQQMQMQMQMKMHPQNRQHFAPGAGPGGGAMGGAGGNMHNGMMDPAGMRRSGSPDPRDGPRENKMPRLR